MKRLLVLVVVVIMAVTALAPVAMAAEPTPYAPAEGALAPVPLAAGAQASFDNLAYKAGKTARIAYMPPATEFNYYMAIGEGIKAKAAELKVETFMLAPQSGSDIATQMKMIQDAITQNVDGIILSTHDEKAAAPLVKQAVDKGIAVVIVNSDIPDFPTPVHGVVGYGQRKGTYKMGMYAAGWVHGKAIVGVLEGLPGYHSTERIGGYLDAFKQFPEMKIVASLPTAWNVETGNKAMMDLLQAHPDINLVVTANDYISMGAATAAAALGRQDVLNFGNDGDTTGMEYINDGKFTGTVNTTPFVMGKVALQVIMDTLNKVYPGGWTETPVVIVDQTNAADYLCQPDKLYPKPSKEYKCPHPVQ
jgi:ribose transport system substrate-binding protein